MAVNYRSHGEPVAVPQPFLKAPSALLAPNQPIVLPADAGRVDEEGEVVAVIGRRARQISVAEVDDHVSVTPVATTCPPVSGRAATCSGGAASRPTRSPPSGPGSRPISTRKRSRFALGSTARRSRDAHTSELVFSIRECISFISQAMTLEPGDLVYTGTPGTTASLSAGDVVEIEADGIGVLRNPVIAG